MKPYAMITAALFVFCVVSTFPCSNSTRSLVRRDASSRVGVHNDCNRAATPLIGNSRPCDLGLAKSFDPQQGMSKIGTDLINGGSLGSIGLPGDKPGPFQRATVGMIMLTVFMPFTFLFGGESHESHV